jgi:hypothetical protein
VAIHEIELCWDSAYAFLRESKNMTRKPFSILAVFIFVVVALLHMVRVTSGWEVITNGETIPMWVSLLGVVLAGGFAFGVLCESQQGKP